MATDYPPTEAARWEYIVVFEHHGSALDHCLMLDKHGAIGWELVAVAEAGGYTSFYFKRRLPPRTGHSWPLTTGS